MKRLLLTSLSGFPQKDSGGPNKIIFYLINNLDNNKFDITFFSKNGQLLKKSLQTGKKNFNLSIQFLKEQLFINSYIYRRIFTSSIYLKKFFRNSISAISSFINNNEFDIVHAHDIRCLFGLRDDLFDKVVLTVHSNGSIVQDMKVFFGERASIKNIFDEFKEREIELVKKQKLVTFPSNSARDLFLTDTGLQFNDFKSRIVYNGIDIDYINSITYDNKFLKDFEFLKNYDLKIFNIANHIKVKNIDKIIHSLFILKKISNKNFIFINVGKGILTPYLNDLVKKYGLENNVYFIKYLCNEDVIRLMKMCDFYISLSERVVFDIVILEALACGLNVIASDEGGNKEVIQNSINGILVNPNDNELIARYLNDSSLDFSKNAIERARSFSLHKMVENYQRIYESITQN